MSRPWACLSAIVILAALAAAPAQAAGHKKPTDQKLIKNATSAAPAAVGRAATVATLDDKGGLRTLRKGTNGFTCLPDNPSSPGNDPMCLDANGVAWAKAWLAGQAPPAGTIGFGYMLRGGSDASNVDPKATAPAPGAHWVTTGPHVMLLSATAATQGYPDAGAEPDTSQPFVMWAGTPYAHLMIPVK